MAEQKKVFNDPIHGTIELHPLLVKIIDTPQFQRLRNIKQLGAVSYVFPGATHSRFEHSIGVAYLAGELLKSIREKQQELGITDWDVLCVQIAALCHDLGHGPFSHMFDLMFLPEARRLKHEELSKKRFHQLMEKYGGLSNQMKDVRKEMTGEDPKKIEKLGKFFEEYLDFIEAFMIPETQHEELSKKMIDHLMEKNDGLLKYMKDVRKEMTGEDRGDPEEIEELKNILKEDLDFIKDLIDPKTKHEDPFKEKIDDLMKKNDGLLEQMEDVQEEMTKENKEDSEKIEKLRKLLKEFQALVNDVIYPNIEAETTPAADLAAGGAGGSEGAGGQGGARKQRPPSNPSEKRYILYEIVSNKRNKIDVDKWDYFVRDCHYLGMRNSFDHERLIKSARACEVDGEWQICYRDKDVFNLYDMFYTRFSLHKRAYQHKVNCAIEWMINDAFLKADKHLSFGGKTLSTAIEDMGAYTKLTDTVFDQILNSTSDELQEARGILERIVKRKPYYCLGEFHSEYTLQVIKENWKTFHQGTPEEYIMDDVPFNYGKRANDPIEDVRFYNKRNPQQAKAITRAEASRLLPERFEEKLHRIYTKRTDKDLKDDEDAFEKFKNNSYKKKKIDAAGACVWLKKKK